MNDASEYDSTILNNSSISSSNRDLNENINANDMSTNNDTTETKPAEKKTSLALDKRLLAGGLVFLLISFLILGENISLVILTFLVGLTLGSLATLGLIYLAHKYNLLKYFFKSFTPTLPIGQSQVGDEATTITSSSQQLQSLLIQTPIQKENKNFHGVYKVNYLFDSLIYTYFSLTRYRLHIRLNLQPKVILCILDTVIPRIIDRRELILKFREVF